ncbi:MAG: hypothetical protein WDW36_001304 [Sanguina aurantia]
MDELYRQIEHLSFKDLVQRCWDLRIQSMLPATERDFKRRAWHMLLRKEQPAGAALFPRIELTPRRSPAGGTSGSGRSGGGGGGGGSTPNSATSPVGSPEGGSPTQPDWWEMFKPASSGSALTAQQPVGGVARPVTKGAAAAAEKRQRKKEAQYVEVHSSWLEFHQQLLGRDRLTDPAAAGVYTKYLEVHASKENLRTALSFHVWDKLAPAALQHA